MEGKKGNEKEGEISGEDGKSKVQMSVNKITVYSLQLGLWLQVVL